MDLLGEQRRKYSFLKPETISADSMKKTQNCPANMVIQHKVTQRMNESIIQLYIDPKANHFSHLPAPSFVTV